MRHKPNTYQHRLLFVANELPSYGYMQGINKNAATMRKYGIKGLYVAQDPEATSKTSTGRSRTSGPIPTAKSSMRPAMIAPPSA